MWRASTILRARADREPIIFSLSRQPFMVEHGLKAGHARSFYRKLTQPYLFLFFNFPKHTVNSGRYGGHDQGSPT
jgi:hypothetical protein